MASPLSSLSISITAIPTSANGSPEKSLYCNFQNLRSTRCLKRVFSKCAVRTLPLKRKQFRESRVACFKSRLQFYQFVKEQVRSGDGTATEYFELGAVMLRRKVYPTATKYLQQAIEKWDRDDQDLAQVYNALGVSYVRDNKLDKGIPQFEAAVKLQPGYVTAWNNMGDAYEKKKNLKMALKTFQQVLLFDPNNKIARPRRDALRERVELYRGVPLKSEER